MLVSFIIPHKGRTELLEQTLQSIANLEFDQTELEVIIVTQNNTLDDLKHENTQFHLQTIFQPGDKTISALRNVGVRHASGEYLVFLDADIQLSPNWLHVMFDELDQHPDRVLVSAIQQCAPEAGIIEQIRVILNNTAADSTVQFLDGRDLFLKRSIFEKAGGFPEHLVTCEDYYFTNTVHQQGELYFTSKASYIHLGEDKSYAEMFRKEIWRGQSNLQSMRGRKIILRELPSFFMPLWQGVLLLLSIISLGIAQIDFAFFSLVISCLPIVLYTLRLYGIGKGRIQFLDALHFYSIYFPARTIGTIIGLFKVVNIS
ncbi:glycosyl transferase, family 2 [Candidatus Vecturithrix granuli]|uniref:Glycosyl transferase, family 2 n=1 Tax=Vecturithrix granuli TaxID=1499967 RepID=A0A081C4B3_VECG1|nr:glycosyl transferase, family 2 [Candidatus Vecturithrix granuli]